MYKRLYHVDAGPVTVNTHGPSEELMRNQDDTDHGHDRSPVVEVTLVTAAGCHFCDDAADLLDELGGIFRLAVQKVELASDEGAAIARRFRVPFPPIVLIDGAYAGHGRISGRKLAKLLDEASGGGGAPMTSPAAGSPNEH